MYQQFAQCVQWKVPTKDGASVGGTAVLSGTVIGPLHTEDIEGEDEDAETNHGMATNPLLGYYDEDSANIPETPSALATLKGSKVTSAKDKNISAAQQKAAQANKTLMPRSVNVSFSVRGWLPSGIRVDSLIIDTRKSRGLGENVKPFKGVKYMTVSRKGVERRG